MDPGPPDVDYTRAAAYRMVLESTLIVVVIDALLLIPSLGWLFTLFQRE